MNLFECMMTNSTCYKGTNKGTPVGILWHDTSAGNPALKRYVQPYKGDKNYDELMKKLGKNIYGNDWNHIKRDAGLNAWIGQLADGSVATCQTMPWDYRPWGCGSGSKGSCNGSSSGKDRSFWIQFEICDDKYKSKDYFNKVYKEACELTAYLCKLYNIDPMGTVTYNGVKVPTILCHQDSYQLGLGGNHSDVYVWFDKYGKTMDDVRKDVAALIGKSTNKPVATNKATIKVGDAVKLSSSATYYDGKSMPNWVKQKNWIVKSVSGDRAVIDKSTDGKKSICSPVNIKYLSVVTSNTEAAPAKKSVEEIAKEVINGKWGNGSDRKKKLTAAGYNYTEVQNMVDKLLKQAATPAKKTVEEIAKEVLNGKWGNGATRKKKLEAAGYNYSEVQAMVNKMCR